MKRVLFSVILLTIILSLGGCGSGGGKGKSLSYFMLTPSDTSVVETSQPTFVMERNTNNTSSALACDSSNTDSHLAKLQVVRIDPQTSVASAVINETISMPNDCQFSIGFPSLTLEENVGYAWHVGEPNEVEDEDTQWNGFIYAPGALDSTSDIACSIPIINNGSFENRPLSWEIHDTSSFIMHSAAILNNGYEGNRSISLASPNLVITQTLSQPIIQNKYYKLRLAIRHQGKSNFQIKAVAYNGTLDGLMPDANKSIVGISGTMTYHQNNWVQVEFPVWRANKAFEKLAISFFHTDPAIQSSIVVDIDAVSLCETENGGCASSELTGLIDADFDYTQSSPVETDFNYLNGTVSDLYPDYNTSTVGWFDDINDTVLSCSSIGGEITPELEDELDAEMQDPQIDQMLTDINMSDANISQHIDDNDDNVTQPTPISSNGVQDKCSYNPHGDPNKPFYGRDIVYIHGLQFPALKGNLKSPKTFQEKWPDDKALFYSGGDIINRATSYWSDHITRQLGSTSTPSNSYLITSWSANQRLNVAIHAVLTQIRDAMDDNNPNVVLSQNAKDTNQCFGANGIVVVTHSTGGLIASSMFGIAEHSHDTSAEIRSYGKTININDYYGDVRYITDRIHMQIGFNSAYSGTYFASTGLAAITAIATTAATDPILRFTINSVLRNKLGGTLQDLYPKIWNSTLVDLMPQVARSRWYPWEASSSIPTLTTTGSFLGKANISPNLGKKLSRGFDDLVLPVASQAGRKRLNYTFTATKKYLKDKGIGKARRRGMLKDGRSGHAWFGLSQDSTRLRNYANTPHLAPTGMIQTLSVTGYPLGIGRVSQSQYIPNHYLVLQNSGTHFSNVDHISKIEADSGQFIHLENNYEWTRGMSLQLVTPHIWPPSISSFDVINHTDHERNYEETAVVVSPNVFNNGYMSADYANLNEEWIRKKTWGLHLPRIIWVLKEVHFLGKTIKLHMPRLTWYYKEWVKWKRSYHLLHDYENKKGADYIYDHALRP